MIIGNSNNPLPFATGSDLKARSPIVKPEGNQSATATGDASEKVGTTSTQLSSLGNTAAPVDASKLAEIKQAISEGRFQINSSAVAGSLVKSVVDLISTR
jgi:negative regulator of flagellin synthesis FlgM